MWEKEEIRTLALDTYEHGILITALNGMRTDLLRENRTTDAVDNVLLKALRAPTQKRKRKARHERE